MKHYKKGKNHIFEFGEMSILRIKLDQSQYEELAGYFAEQPVIESVCDECNGTGRWKDDEFSKEIDCPKCKGISISMYVEPYTSPVNTEKVQKSAT